MITRVVKTLQRPFFWFLLQTTRNESWQRYKCNVPLHVYGAGSRRKFDWYFEGETDTGEMHLDEMKYWLSHCEYVTDDELFNERDVWQHPITFERLRKGDCEDFSLWVWRKLVDQDMHAEFVAGWTVHPGELYQGHAWVMFRNDKETFLFDPVAEDQSRMVRKLSEVSEWYVPQVSIDHTMNQYVYGGYYSQLRPMWECERE